MLRDFPREAADALLAAAGPDIDRPALMIEFRHLGGALANDPAVPNAVGNRDVRFQLFAGAVAAPAMHEELQAPLTALVAALRPWSTGRKQVNFLSGYDDTPEAVASAYDPAAWECPVGVKTVYDPRTLFRVNRNIPRHG